MQVELQRESRENVPLFPIRIKFFGTIQQNKKGLSLRASLFLFLSSNEVKSRFEPLYLATMPLTTSICFFSTRSLCASDAAARICKSSRLPISNVLPQRRCRRQSIYCTCLFFLHVIQPKFKRKKHLPHKFYNKKAFFTQKNLFFTQYSLTQEFQDFCRALLQLTLGTQSVFVAAKLLLGYLLLLFVGSSLATASLCFYSRWCKIRKQQTSESLTVKKVVFNYQNPVCNKLYLSLERLLN